MIGKLFATPYRPPPESQIPAAIYDSQSIASAHSVIDEASTRNLLYGATTLLATSLSQIDPSRDIRVVILTDLPFIEYTLFDSEPPARPPTYFTEIPSFHALQERVFGSSQIKYNGPITKLHLFPLKDRKARQKWLVSRLFRLNSAQAPYRANRGLTAQSLNNCASQDAGRNGTSPAKGNDAWQVQTQAHTPPSIADYTCAICVFVSAGADPQSCITNYWEEFSAALIQLQNTVADRLAVSLPLTYREVKQLRTLADPYNYQALSLTHDQDIRTAVAAFKHRFIDVVRIPRVICGQDRWPELMSELRWAAACFDHPSNNRFLATAIATFIKCNHELLTIDRRSANSTALGRIPKRTVVVGDRIATRRMIFILTMLIRDSYTQLGKFLTPPPNDDQPDYFDDTIRSPERSLSGTSLSNATTAAFLVQGGVGWEIPKSESASVAECPSICTVSHVIRPSFSSGSLKSLSSSPSPAAASRLSALTNMAAGTYNNKHVAAKTMRRGSQFSINSFSPSSLTSSLSTSLSNSFLGSLWIAPRPHRANSNLGTDEIRFGGSAIIDDKPGDDLGYYNDPLTAAPYPAVATTRYAAAERTATTLPSPLFNKDFGSSAAMATLTLNSRRNSTASRTSTRSISSSALSLMVMDHTGGSGSQHSAETAASSTVLLPVCRSFESVPYLDKSAVCLDVPALEDDDEPYLDEFACTGGGTGEMVSSRHHHHPRQYEDAEPVILPPVAGHNAEFHPDFVVQGCPRTRDLEDAIIKAMKQDGNACSSEGLVGSQTVVIDTSRMDVVIYECVASGPSPSHGEGEGQDRKEVQVKQPDVLVSKQEIESVDTELALILKTRDWAALKQGYDSRFHLF